jgi:maleylacetoacetate isomerase
LIRLYRARFSTNVERVALALAHKGLEVESVWIDYSDRSAVEAVSDQGLVPVLVDDDTVVSDSPVILQWLEAKYREPRLFPVDLARRMEMEFFIDWFNLVWKTWPNGIEAELGEPEPNHELIDLYSDDMWRALNRLDRMLAGRDHLMGDELSAADCIAYPFLKYALRRDPDDDELFHRILEEHQSTENRPRLEAWIKRVDGRPRV